jgi:hypothetical protein
LVAQVARRESIERDVVSDRERKRALFARHEPPIDGSEPLLARFDPHTGGFGSLLARFEPLLARLSPHDRRFEPNIARVHSNIPRVRPNIATVPPIKLTFVAYLFARETYPYAWESHELRVAWNKRQVDRIKAHPHVSLWTRGIYLCTREVRLYDM